VNGEQTEVVGVAPAVMDRAGSPDIWMPARFDEANPPTGGFGWNAIARLKTGVSPEQAAADLVPAR
jgi:hypothetical protein